MLNFMSSTVLRLSLAALSLAAIVAPAAAGPLAPTSIGARTTSFSDELGQQVVLDSFAGLRVGGFRVDYGYDARVRMGFVTDIAASFHVAGLEPTLPAILSLLVTESWGYSGDALLEVSIYASTGAVAAEDFFASSLPAGELPVITIPMGDYGGAPRIIDLDLTAFVQWARAAGVDDLGVRFHVDGGAHPAFVTMDGLLLGAGPSAIPEPSSSALLFTAGASLGLLRWMRPRPASGCSRWRQAGSPV